MSNVVLKVENISKEYRLGAIGGGTLRGDLQSFMARIRGKDDPNMKIGQEAVNSHTCFMALSGVSFEVNKGDTLGIIGHNGAGKSTLLKLLSRVTAPTSGFIKMNGRIASMLEVGTGFHPELTGRENVYLNGAILGMSRAEVQKKFDEIVSFAEMEKFIDTPVKRYSSGMYVKLAFAVAAHLDSEILVMDEVLAVGDMKFQEKCLGKMGDVADKDGKTVLYVSHSMNTMRQLCNRCLVLDHGTVKYDGDVEHSIELYMDRISEFKEYVDFSDFKRPAYIDGESLELKYLRVLDRNSSVFINEDDGIRLSVGYIAKRSEENVVFRMEISYADGTMAGTAFSDKVTSFEKGDEGEIVMKIDVGNLAPGNYQVVLLAYQSNLFGSERRLDRVEPALTFKIDESQKKGSVAWTHKYWGHVKLNEIKIVENNILK